MKKIVFFALICALFLITSEELFPLTRSINEEGILVNEVVKTYIPESWGQIIAIHREPTHRLILFLSTPDALRIVFGSLYSDDFSINKVMKIRRSKGETSSRQESR